MKTNKIIFEKSYPLRKFIRFLKEHDAYLPFINNMIKLNKDNNIYDFSQMSPETYINWGFCWRESLEGRPYWQKLNYLWMRIHCHETIEKCNDYINSDEYVAYNMAELEKNELAMLSNYERKK